MEDITNEDCTHAKFKKKNNQVNIIYVCSTGYIIANLHIWQLS